MFRIQHSSIKPIISSVINIHNYVCEIGFYYFKLVKVATDYRVQTFFIVNLLYPIQYWITVIYVLNEHDYHGVLLQAAADLELYFF